jgi:hypothetical protein
MASKTKPPRLATGAALECVPPERLNGSSNSPSNVQRPVTLQTTLFPIWVGGKSGYLYDVKLAGDTIVRRSRDPYHDVARALLARGHAGSFDIVDAGGAPLMRHDIERAALLRVVEDSRGGFYIRKWSPSPYVAAGAANCASDEPSTRRGHSKPKKLRTCGGAVAPSQRHR